MTPRQNSATFEPLDESRVRSEYDRMKAKVGRRYWDCRLDNFRLHGGEKETARQRAALNSLQLYADDLETNLRDGNGLVLFGPTGTGKDHLLAALIERLFTDGWVKRG